MLDEVATAIATGAAGNIVAYMLNNQVDALHAKIATIFRHGSGHERAAALHAVERDVQALGEHKVTRADLVVQWGDLLRSYLAAHPEAHEDVESLTPTQVTKKTIIIGSQEHFGSGPQIAGDNYGSITFGG
ncbi:MAG TPA: hypothetical protein VHZ33_07145 [Trebonia sp.]|jgi:hypothetical protein|nr:hypothetical protein [Trebonia sp.]